MDLLTERMKSMENNAVIYARYSAGPRQTDQSIEGQIADCKKYAEQHGLVVSKIYADKHISGKSTEGREEFLQMISDARKKLFNAVIVWKIDRFGRDKTDIAIYKRELRKNGITLHYAAEAVPEGPEGIILESLLEGLAEYYSADLRQKVTRGMKESLKKNQWPGKCPYGYTKDPDKHIIIVPEQAAVVKKIFKLHNEGHSIAEILRILTSTGIYLKNGSIYRILTNKHYTGKFEMMGITVEAEPIITEEVWEMSKEKFGSSKKGGAKINYLLSGKCVCSECQSVLTGTHGTSKNGKKFAYYQCPNKCIKPIPKEKYEQIILEEIQENVLSDEIIEQIVDRVMELQSEDLPHAEIKRIEGLICDFKKKVDNLYIAIEDGLKIEYVKDRIDDYNQKIEDLNIELERLKIKKPLIPREYLVQWLDSFRSGSIASDDFCEKLIQTFISSIVIYSDHSVIVLNISGEQKCSNLSRLVNLTQQCSNTEKVICFLPYAMFRIEL